MPLPFTVDRLRLWVFAVIPNPGFLRMRDPGLALESIQIPRRFALLGMTSLAFPSHVSRLTPLGSPALPDSMQLQSLCVQLLHFKV